MWSIRNMAQYPSFQSIGQKPRALFMIEYGMNGCKSQPSPYSAALQVLNSLIGDLVGEREGRFLNERYMANGRDGPCSAASTVE